MTTIELSDNQAAALQAKALRCGLTLKDWLVKLAAEDEQSPSDAPRKPLIPGRGMLAKYGPGPSAGKIDENRKEMFHGFGANLADTQTAPGWDTALIKDAVVHLSDTERKEFARWLEELAEEEWDKQIERDFSPGGRGIPLLAELEREIAEGKTRPIEEVCAERRRQ